LGCALNKRVAFYLLISTIMVYRDIYHDGAENQKKITEDSPILSYEGEADPFSITVPGNVREYGALKVLCETEAERQFPGRTLVLRPGYIVGPGDPQGLLTYWPIRARRGSEMLAVGDPSMPVQFIDVRDMADWAVRMIEQRSTGIYNTVGPVGAVSLGEVI